MNRIIVTPLTSTAVGAGTNGITFGPFPCNGNVLTIGLENTGTIALATFVLQGKAHPSTLAFETLISGTNWATSHPLVIQSDALGTLGSNSAGFAMVRTMGMSVLQFTATVSGTVNTSVNINPTFVEAQ